MYAWLVMVTCLSWTALLALRESARWGRVAAFALSQVALAYSQPLGLLMIVAQALAFLLARSMFRLTLARWIAVEAVVVLAILPWLPHYLDHPPESVTGPLPIQYLLTLPIGFTGGNRLTLLAAFALVAWALLGKRRARPSSPLDAGQTSDIPARGLALDHPEEFTLLACWLAVPPVLLYVYSRVSQPIFGPARYTLFVGPAYLLLLARGLVKLPVWVRVASALGVAILAGSMLGQAVYAPGLKADWRGAAEQLAPQHPGATWVILSGDPARNVEVETARYYLGSVSRVIPLAQAEVHPPAAEVLFAVGLKNGVPVAEVPDELAHLYRFDQTWTIPGLRIQRAVKRPP